MSFKFETNFSNSTFFALLDQQLETFFMATINVIENAKMNTNVDNTMESASAIPAEEDLVDSPTPTQANDSKSLFTTTTTTTTTSTNDSFSPPTVGLTTRPQMLYHSNQTSNQSASRNDSEATLSSSVVSTNKNYFDSNTHVANIDDPASLFEATTVAATAKLLANSSLSHHSTSAAVASSTCKKLLELLNLLLIVSYFSK